MLKEGRKAQQLVQVEHIVNFMLASMPQEINHQTTAQQEMFKLFDEGEKTQDESFGKYIQIENVKKAFKEADFTIH